MTNGIPHSDKELLLKGLQKVEKIAGAPKWHRLLSNPANYLVAILHRLLVFRRTKKSKTATTRTFFGEKMHILLPSSTDIYLTGGKSHSSEINLARFLVHQLNPGDVFMDIGAHYGYFSLLGAAIVGSEGSVWSFEASPTTYSILHQNTSPKSNIHAFHHAIADTHENLTFFEFPNLYSEYNTLDISQFEGESWFSKFQPKEVIVEAIVMDEFAEMNDITPKIIKIDVEGAEFKVISGMQRMLREQSPILVMEFLSEIRGNEEHLKARQLLLDNRYHSYSISQDGSLSPVVNIEAYLRDQEVDSDNIVFKK